MTSETAEDECILRLEFDDDDDDDVVTGINLSTEIIASAAVGDCHKLVYKEYQGEDFSHYLQDPPDPHPILNPHRFIISSRSSFKTTKTGSTSGVSGALSSAAKKKKKSAKKKKNKTLKEADSYICDGGSPRYDGSRHRYNVSPKLRHSSKYTANRGVEAGPGGGERGVGGNGGIEGVEFCCQTPPSGRAESKSSTSRLRRMLRRIGRNAKDSVSDRGYHYHHNNNHNHNHGHNQQKAYDQQYQPLPKNGESATQFCYSPRGIGSIAPVPSMTAATSDGSSGSVKLHYISYAQTKIGSGGTEPGPLPAPDQEAGQQGQESFRAVLSPVSPQYGYWRRAQAARTDGGKLTLHITTPTFDMRRDGAMGCGADKSVGGARGKDQNGGYKGERIGPDGRERVLAQAEEAAKIKDCRMGIAKSGGDQAEAEGIDVGDGNRLIHIPREELQNSAVVSIAQASSPRHSNIAIMVSSPPRSDAIVTESSTPRHRDVAVMTSSPYMSSRCSDNSRSKPWSSGDHCTTFSVVEGGSTNSRSRRCVSEPNLLDNGELTSPAGLSPLLQENGMPPHHRQPSPRCFSATAGRVERMSREEYDGDIIAVCKNKRTLWQKIAMAFSLTTQRRKEKTKKTASTYELVVTESPQTSPRLQDSRN